MSSYLFQEVFQKLQCHLMASSQVSLRKKKIQILSSPVIEFPARLSCGILWGLAQDVVKLARRGGGTPSFRKLFVCLVLPILYWNTLETWGQTEKNASWTNQSWKSLEKSSWKCVGLFFITCFWVANTYFLL